jgi:hypothetical protein
LIAQQFGVSVERILDATNTLVKKGQAIIKNIARPNAFVDKVQWSVICMKKEYHAKFMAITNRKWPFCN